MLKLSGWNISYADKTINVISERNRNIENAVKLGAAGGLGIEDLSEQIRGQAHLGDVECVNAIMFIKQERAICDKIEALLKGYSHLSGVKLKGFAPAALDDAVQALELIAKSVVPDFPSADAPHVP